MAYQGDNIYSWEDDEGTPNFSNQKPKRTGMRDIGASTSRKNTGQPSSPYGWSPEEEEEYQRFRRGEDVFGSPQESKTTDRAGLREVETTTPRESREPQTSPYGWSAEEEEEYQQFLRGDGEFAPTPVKREEEEASGAVDAFKGGAEKLWHSLGLTADVYTDDEEGALEKAEDLQSTPSTQAQKEFMRSFKGKTEDNRTDSLWHEAIDTGKDFVSAAIENPKGFMHTSIEQIPNMAPMMVGAWSGGKAGALSTSWVPLPGARVVGGVVGGVLGMFLGNTAVETGFHGAEVISEEGFDRNKIIGEGAEKAAWITAADTIGLGVTSAMNKAMVRPMMKAGQRATARVLEKAGMDQLDDVALQAALKANPEVSSAIKKAVEKAAVEAAPSKAKRALVDSISFTNEMFTEGLGEYTGSAAIGDASMMEAVLEAGSAGFTAAGQVAMGKAISGTKGLLKGQKSPESALSSDPNEANAGDQSNRDALNDVIAGEELSQEEQRTVSAFGQELDSVDPESMGVDDAEALVDSPEYERLKPHLQQLVTDRKIADLEATDRTPEQDQQLEELKTERIRLKQDPAIVKERNRQAREIDTSKNEKRFNEDPLDEENNLEYLSKLTEQGAEDQDASVKMMISKDEKQQLYDIGYTESAVKKMEPAEAAEILKGKEVRDAESIREDAEQIQRGRLERQGGERKGGEDIQQQAPRQAGLEEGTQAQTQIEESLFSEEDEQNLMTVDTEPTEGQKKSGTYSKAHPRVDGFDMTVENPAGSTRKGTDEDGNNWSQKMQSHYGYFKRSEGKDGDQVDAFVNPKGKKGRSFFVVDQYDKQGNFDEHKVMVGFDNEQEARDAYLANYEDGWTGLGDVTEMDKGAFKDWLGDGKRTRKPAADRTAQAPASETTTKLTYDASPEGQEVTPEQSQARISQLRDAVGKKKREVSRASQGSRQTKLSALNRYQDDLTALENQWSEWEKSNPEEVKAYQERQESLKDLKPGDTVDAHHYGELEVTKVNDKTIRASKDGQEIEGLIPKTAISKSSTKQAETDKVKGKNKKDDLRDTKKRDATKPKQRGSQQQRLNEASELLDGRGARTAKVVPAVKKSHKELKKIGNKFGSRIIFYETTKGSKMSEHDGVFIPSDPGSIYLNVDGKNPMMFTLGHELVHQLRKNNFDLYMHLLENIAFQKGKFDQLRKEFRAVRQGTPAAAASDASILEELIGDFSGEQFQNPEFWQKMREKNESFTQRIIKVITDIINKMKSVSPETTQHIENFDQSLDALASAMSQFAEEGAGKGTGKKAKFSKQSTRVPTAKSATENALDDLLTVDFDIARNDKSTLEKNVEFFKSLPNLRPTKAKDETVANNMINHMVNNILWLYDQVSEHVRDRARQWYDGANRISKRFAKKYGISEMQSAAVIATMSPNNEWFQNVSVAERVLDIVSTKQNVKWTQAMTETFRKDKMPGSMKDVKGKKLKDILTNPKAAAKWVRTYDQTYNDRSRNLILPEGGTAGAILTAKGVPAKTAWGTYIEIGKAISILMDGRAENIHYQLSWSHKVRNFYNNIYDPSSDKFVTIDTHAVGVSLLQSYAGEHPAVQHVFGGRGAESTKTGLQGSYPYHAEAYKRAAEKRGILPREMQSIVWVGKQSLFGKKFQVNTKNGKSIAALWEQYNKKKLSQEEVQQKILELTGGLSTPPWVAEPYNETFDTSYPKDEATIKKLEKFPEKSIEVDFEVAPHPDNDVMQGAWNQASEDLKTELSVSVASEMIPKILKEFSTSGDLQTQVGGYEGAGNVAFGLKVENSALSVPIAKMIGYVLSQKSVVVASDKKIPGTDKVDIITIYLPEGYSVDKINKLYYDLYSLTDKEGSRLVEGHTTAKDQMAILNFTGLNSDALKNKIKRRLERFSPDEDFKIAVGGGYSALINEKEYDYDSYRPRTAEEIAAGSPVLRRPDKLREEATKRLEEGLREAGIKFSKADRAGSQGAVQLSHWSRQPGLKKLDPSYHGQGLKGKESKRKEEDPDYWVDRTYFGLPGYKKEPGLGSEKYTTSLPAEQLYDFNEDPDNLKSKISEVKAAATGFPPNNLSVYEKLIKDAGYKGYTVGNVAAVFEPLEVIPDLAQGQAQDRDIKFSKAPEYKPNKTIKAYKIFRTLKSKPGDIFPLFIGKSKPTPQGTWVKAEFIPTKGFAQRPGWHAGTLPIAPHLRTKQDRIAEGRVWAEVEMPADKDWQSIADKSKTKDIRDKVPEDGYYRFKVSKMQGGAWHIGGAIKINRLLSDAEVGQILTENGFDTEEARKEMQDPDVKFSKAPPVESKEFKNWFGDSEITNPDGSPRVVYHGTKELFNEFKARFNDRLFFFSTNPEWTSQWALSRNKKPENLRNFSWSDKAEKELQDHWAEFYERSDELYKTDKAEWMRQYDELNRTSPPRRARVEMDSDAAVYPVYIKADKMFNPKEDFKQVEDTLRSMPSMKGMIEAGHHKEGNWLVYENEEVVNKIQSLGYDGIWLQESPTEGAPMETIAVWSPTQVKSATGNVGTYDPTNPDIRFSKAPAEKWYSQMRGTLDKKLSKAAPAQQVKQQVQAWAKKGEFKQEELEWSGLTQWMDSQKGKVSKQDVLDYLDRNHVRIEEVVKGRDNPWKVITTDGTEEYFPSEEKAQELYQEELDWIENELVDIDGSKEEGYVQVYDFDNNMLFAAEYNEDTGTYIKDTEVAHGYDEDFDSYAEAVERAQEVAEDTRRNFRDDSPLRAPEIDDVEVDTEYHDYQTPGGDNYKELLITMPAKRRMSFSEFLEAYRKRFPNADTTEEDVRGFYDQGMEIPGAGLSSKKQDVYTSSHWDNESNVLAHVRLNERTDSEGNRVLFLEEVQSDWHQAGRKKGYGRYTEEQARDYQNDIYARFERGEINREQRDQEISRLSDMRSGTATVPDAPFKKSWPLLAVKRMVRYAAENGFDKIAWTPGEIQAERYDLSKQVDSIRVTKRAKGWEFDAKKNGENLASKQGLSENELADNIGKDLADKAVSDLGKQQGQATKVYSGLDLKVGGEGMKGFYDKILPAEVNKFFNKKAWGKAKVTTINLKTVSEKEAVFREDFNSEDDVWEAIGGDDMLVDEQGALRPGLKIEKLSNEKWNLFDVGRNGITKTQAHSLPITPEMKSKALREGMPLFSKARRTDTPAFKRWFGKSKAKTKDGKPVPLYHGTPESFTVFEKDKLGGETKHTSSGLGFFFTTSKKSAQHYAGDHGSIMPVYLRMERPYKMSLKKAQSFETFEDSVKFRGKLENKGHDSIIIYHEDNKTPYAFIVFESQQAKSVQNTGLWTEDPDIRFSKAPAEYPDSLNQVQNNTNLTHLKKHPDYKKAKYGGDVIAAKRVVDKIVKPKVIKDIQQQLDPGKKVYIVPVGHREGESVNMLPLAYADKLNTSLPNSVIWSEIVKVAGNANTGASAEARMGNKQLFAGDPPPADGQIVVVDDTLTSGQTFKHLIDAFEDTPTVATTLAVGRYGKSLKPTKEMQKKLLDRGGLSVLQFKYETNQDISELTAGQIQQYLLNGRKGKDGIRARFRQERGRQSSGQAPQTPQVKFSKASAEKWYSALTKAVESVDQKSMPAKQWSQMLTSNKFKQQGVKEDELAWTGVREWLANQQGKVSKSSIMDYLDRNHARIEEVEKGGLGFEGRAARQEELIDKENEGTITEEELAELDEIDALVHSGTQYTEDTKYSEHTEPGGVNYRELLLTMPESTITGKAYVEDFGGHYAVIGPEGNLKGQYPKSDPTAKKRAEKHAEQISDVSLRAPEKDYTSPHYDEPNVFVTARMSDYTDSDGDRVLVLHEIQDDWASDIRKKGTGESRKSALNDKYLENLDKLDERDEAVNIQWMRDNPDSLSDLQRETVSIWEEMQTAEGSAYDSGVPDYPFKNTSYDLMLRRLVRYAAENGYDKLGWFPGSTHTKRWGSEKIAWEKTKGGWNVEVKEQDAGEVGGINIEEAARAEGLLTDTHDLVLVEDKADLKNAIRTIAERQRDTYSAENFEKMLDARTEKIWARMQKEDSGVSFPRKESFENIYDEQLPNKANEFFNKKKWGKSKAGKSEITVPEEGQYKITFGNGRFTSYRTTEEAAKKLVKMTNEAGKYTDATYEKVDNLTNKASIHTLPITDQMENKALTEGMPLFSKARVELSEADRPITQEDYDKAAEDTTNLRSAATTELKNNTRDIKKGFDKYLGVWSTRIGNISTRLKEKARKLTLDTNRNTMRDIEKVKPLLEKAKKNMTKRDFKEWDYARKNSDLDKLEELIERYDLRQEYIAYRKVIDSIRNKGLDVGLDLGYIEEYAPRILKDHKGFLEAVGKDPDWKVISRKLREKAEALGTTVDQLDTEQKAEIVSSMLRSGDIGLGGVPATKERKLGKIPGELSKFYMHSDAALIAHIGSMHKVIEARKFFGRVPEKVNRMRLRLRSAQQRILEANQNLGGVLSPAQQRELAKLNSKLKADRATDAEKRRIKKLENIKTDTMPDEQITEIKKRRNEIIGSEKELQAYVDKYANQRDFSANINTLVLELVESGEITGAQEQELVELLDARFHERGTRGPLQAYKNFSYMDTMGSPISALTQIGDLAWSAYEGGLFLGVPRTLRNAIRAGFKKSKITREDVGMDRIAQEFEDPGNLGNMVNKVFTAVGLTKIDAIGKESLMNTALEKAQRDAKKNPDQLRERLLPMFEDETEQVIDDLVNDRISENVIMMVHSRLLDFQAMGLSEVPEMYQRAGNGRIFYMLKTFTIKQFDIFRNEAYHKLTSPNLKTKIEGMRNLTTLAMFFVMANAGADELKDWVLGRETDLSDRAMDNILRLMGVSKFVTWKMRTEGAGSALVRQILPPFKFIDSAGKDIYNAGDEKGLEIVGSLPLVGKIYYWRAGRGTHKRVDLWDRRLLKKKRKAREAAEGLEEAADKQAYRRKHRDDLILNRRINNLQPELNKLRRRINEIKEREETERRKALIKTLEKRRTDKIRRFLDRIE